MTRVATLSQVCTKGPSLPALPATALTSLPCPAHLMPAGLTTLMVLALPLPHCVEDSAKPKPELGIFVSLAFLHTSVLMLGVEGKLSTYASLAKSTTILCSCGKHPFIRYASGAEDQLVREAMNLED